MAEKRIPYRKIWIFILLWHGLTVVISSCRSLSAQTSCEGFSPNLKVNLPPSTRNLQEYCYQGLNPSYKAEFTISPSDLKTLQQQYPLSKDQWYLQISSRIFADSALSDLRERGKKMRSLLYADY
ncbi:MAG: hypothetical protein HC851_06120 [Acaryochloris sp. RU_4_1]|nr:hypothetical protein [Acaryochloris sp. RU_4_1]NJR54831.1 hypothetical protein [Acaryochloris sp. CRU_2_0]